LTSAITVEAWIDAPTSSSYEGVVDKGRDLYGGWSLNIGEIPNKASFKVHISGTNRDIIAGGNYIANSWTQLVGTFDGTTLKIYQNGTLSNSILYSGTIGTDSYPLSIGDTNDGLFYNGLISNVQLYSIALTPTQVRQLYKEGPVGAPISTSNVVGWWPLNGNAYDYSGNGNTGTPTSVTYPSANAIGPFQQMLTLNASQYSAYERSDLGNIRFYQNNIALYSWCESGCSSASTNSIFWVKLPNGIPSSSPVVITMAFLPKYADYNAGAGAHAGECPTCSSTYAQYDNGANVFSFYDAFVGTSLNTKVWSFGTSGGSYSVSNGFTINGGSNYAALSYTPTIAPIYYYDADVTSYTAGTGSTGFDAQLGPLWGWGTWGSATYLTFRDTNNGNTYPSALLPAVGIWSVDSLGPSAKGYGLLNYYNQQISSTTCSSSSSTIGNVYLEAVGSGPNTVQWVRLRLAPPNNIMPVASFSPAVVNLV
jgi:hypothetical protein